MNYFVLSEMMLFLCAISLDNLFVGMSYGMEKIKMPFFSIFTMNIISVSVLFVSFLIGHFFSSILNEISKMIGFLCLFLLGCFKLFDCLLKHYFKKRENNLIEFRFFHFLISIYMDPKSADEDFSKTLSVKESISLAFILSLDGVGAGVGGGILYSKYGMLCFFAFFFGVFFIYLGKIMGSFLSKRVCFDLNWVSGVVFILLAFLKI